MASVIVFGLISSTALNMLVVPAAYYALHQRQPRQPTSQPDAIRRSDKAANGCEPEA